MRVFGDKSRLGLYSERRTHKEKHIYNSLSTQGKDHLHPQPHDPLLCNYPCTRLFSPERVRSDTAVAVHHIQDADDTVLDNGPYRSIVYRFTQSTETPPPNPPSLPIHPLRPTNVSSPGPTEVLMAVLFKDTRRSPLRSVFAQLLCGTKEAP